MHILLVLARFVVGNVVFRNRQRNIVCQIVKIWLACSIALSFALNVLRMLESAR